LLELARQLGNVSQACKMMGYSRDSFYRFMDPRVTAVTVHRLVSECACPVSLLNDEIGPRP
jgi:hypothetical protein